MLARAGNGQSFRPFESLTSLREGLQTYDMLDNIQIIPCIGKAKINLQNIIGAHVEALMGLTVATMETRLLCLFYPWITSASFYAKLSTVCCKIHALPNHAGINPILQTTDVNSKYRTLSDGVI